MEVVVWGRLRGGEVGVRRRFEKKKIAGRGGRCVGEADFSFVCDCVYLSLLGTTYICWTKCDILKSLNWRDNRKFRWGREGGIGGWGLSPYIITGIKDSRGGDLLWGFFFFFVFIFFLSVFVLYIHTAICINRVNALFTSIIKERKGEKKKSIPSPKKFIIIYLIHILLQPSARNPSSPFQCIRETCF